MGIGGPEPRLPDMVNILQAITPSQRLFVFIGALGGCTAIYQAKLQDSLKQNNLRSPEVPAHT